MADANPDFEMVDADTRLARLEPRLHRWGAGSRILCRTDVRGHARPGGRGPDELVLDATAGFVPLWGPDVTLHWRFRSGSLTAFRDPAAAARGVRGLMTAGLNLWGDAVPVRFVESEQPWDFEVAVATAPECDARGCVLASAFFPGGGQEELALYPTLFEQSEAEQAETMAHEFGHVFGLRHWFALAREGAWPAVLFGRQDPFTIMNYGPDSRMTDADRQDLKTLYAEAWAGRLTRIGNTPVRLMRPYSEHAMPAPVRFG